MEKSVGPDFNELVNSVPTSHQPTRAQSEKTI